MRSYVFFLFFSFLLAAVFAQPFIGALLWCWIAFMNPHRSVWGDFSTLPYAMAIFVVWFAALTMSREEKRFEANGVTIGLIVLAVLMTVSSIATIGPADETWRIWERTMKTILGALLVACMLTTRERIHAIIWMMAISMGYYGIKGGLFTLVTGGGNIVAGPPDSMIGDRNHLAVAMLISVPLMNYLRMQSAHRLVRLGIMATMGVTIVAAVGTQSRGALVALACTAAILWLRSRGKIMSGVVIAACLAGTLAFMPESWEERMRTITTYEEDASAMGRVRIWEASWLLALERPLIGTGFRSPYYQSVVNLVAPQVTARAVHSIYFEVIGEHGFPAFAVWLSLSGFGAFYAWRLTRLAKGRPHLAWAGDLGRMVPVSMVAYLTGGAFLSLSYWDLYWILLIATASAYRIAVASLHEQKAGQRLPASTSWPRPAAQGAIS